MGDTRQTPGLNPWRIILIMLLEMKNKTENVKKCSKNTQDTACGNTLYTVLISYYKTIDYHTHISLLGIPFQIHGH